MDDQEAVVHPPLAVLVQLLAEDVGDLHPAGEFEAELVNRAWRHAAFEGVAADQGGPEEGVRDEAADEDLRLLRGVGAEGIGVAALEVAVEVARGQDVADGAVGWLRGCGGDERGAGGLAPLGEEQPELEQHPQEEGGSHEEDDLLFGHLLGHGRVLWPARSRGE